MSRAACLLGAVLLLSLYTGGCSSSHRPLFAEGREQPLLLWPPPGEPRIEWLQLVRGQDAGRAGDGWWGRFKRALTGVTGRPYLRPHGVYAWNETVALTDPGAGCVHLIDLEGGASQTLTGPEDAPLVSPMGITGDGTGRLYITDSVRAQVYRYECDTGRWEGVAPDVPLQRPTGIAYHPGNGFLYVVDTLAHAVVVLGASGYEIDRWGGRGAAPGRFSYPTHLSTDPQGRLWVTDSLNYRVQGFTREGQVVRVFGEAGDTSGRFARPKGVAVDSDGNVYVADALFDAVQVFDEHGRLLLVFGERGSRAGQLWMPAGLHVDAHNRVFVVDTYNQRLQVFRYLPATPAGSF